MANNPIDANLFRHYLRFISLGRTDLYEISEPLGFDAANFVKKQESKRYARSIEYGSIDKLTFVDAYSIPVSAERAINPQGDTSTHMDYGLSWLLPIAQDFGFEAEVEYILEKNGLQFSNGMLDFTEDGLTDGYTFISCKLVQKNKVANLKRRLDDKFNAFSDKNVNQETITPAPTVDFVLASTPERQESLFELGESKELVAGFFGPFNNFSAQVVKFGVRNTLTFFSQELFSSSFVNACNNFRVLKAQNDLSQVTVGMSSELTLQYRTDGGSGSSTAGSQLLGVIFQYPMTVGTISEAQTIVLTSIYLTGTSDQDYTFPAEASFSMPDIPRGYSMALFWDYEWNSEHISETKWLLNKCDFTINAVSTGINTVSKGVWWVDLYKQAAKFTDALPVTSQELGEGGPDHDNVCFNSKMIVQDISEFTMECKKVFESGEEVNMDYEPDEDGIFVGHQRQFYTNDEIGAFLVLPGEDITIDENERCQINKLKYKYKTFEQDRTSVGTNIAIHTDSENSILNKNVENVKEVQVEFVADPLAIQAAVNIKVKDPSISSDVDDKVYKTNLTSLAPSSFNTFGAVLSMRVNDGKLEILNRDGTGDGDNVLLNWLILGISVGSSFQILAGKNIGTYTVFSITNSVIVLTPVSATMDFDGDAYISVKYFYTNVIWISRTTEGFISNTNSLQNVAYSIKRNILRFGEYLASCLIYAKKNIFNTYFKSNGDYSSQMSSEAEPVVENAPILYSDLPNPLTTAKVYNLTCVAEFEEVLAYLQAYKVSRGFIRCYDSVGRVVKGYVQKLDHNWSTNMIKFTIEQKFETEFLIINTTPEGIYVNDTPYNISGISRWWDFRNDYLKLYDSQNRPLSNFYKYNFVLLNGVAYESKEELSQALLNL